MMWKQLQGNSLKIVEHRAPWLTPRVHEGAMGTWQCNHNCISTLWRFHILPTAESLSMFLFSFLCCFHDLLRMELQRKGLTSSISNLPMVPTGKELLPSFYKWGNWASKKIHLNCLLDHSDPSCWARFLIKTCHFKTFSNSIQRKSHLLVGLVYPARCLRSQTQVFLQQWWSGRLFQLSHLPPRKTTAPRITQGWNRTSDGAQSPAAGKGVKACH